MWKNLFLVSGVVIIFSIFSNVTPHCRHHEEELQEFPKDCGELYRNGKGSGFYVVRPENSPFPIQVECNMDPRWNGSWAYIFRRRNNSQAFNLGWYDYAIGFGNLGADFWLGLGNICYMTRHTVNELLMVQTDAKGELTYAHYKYFAIGESATTYTLKLIGGFSGNATDALSASGGSKFSAHDFDYTEDKAVKTHQGGWWYKKTGISNPTGVNVTGQSQRMFWDALQFQHNEIIIDIGIMIKVKRYS